MDLGIIGFWHSGKSALFGSLCGGRSETLKHPDDGWHSEYSTLKIHDPRAEALVNAFKPAKTTLATFHVTDVVGPPATTQETPGRKASILEYQIQHLATTDTFIAMIRAFETTELPPVDPVDEVANIILELVLSDLSKVENRLPGLEKSINKVGGKEKDQLQTERQALLKAKDILEKQKPLCEVDFSSAEEKVIRGFQFASKKPILFVINTDSENPAESEPLCQKLKEQYPAASYGFMGLNAEIEKEILEFPPEERGEFMKDYHIDEPASDKVIREVINLNSLISFYTIGEKELHVWLIREGTHALDAAGMIHTDFARGFIRAEVLNWQDMIDVQGFSHGRREGKVRSEGKHYVVKDGDVINILFNI
jgi:GTP-binding protein YchF